MACGLPALSHDPSWRTSRARAGHTRRAGTAGRPRCPRQGPCRAYPLRWSRFFDLGAAIVVEAWNKSAAPDCDRLGVRIGDKEYFSERSVMPGGNDAYRLAIPMPAKEEHHGQNPSAISRRIPFTPQSKSDGCLRAMAAYAHSFSTIAGVKRSISKESANYADRSVQFL